MLYTFSGIGCWQFLLSMSAQMPGVAFQAKKVVAFLMCIMLITSEVKHLFLYLLVITNND